MGEPVLFSLEKTRVKPGTVLVETVLSRDSLYDQMQQWLNFLYKLPKVQWSITKCNDG